MTNLFLYLALTASGTSESDMPTHKGAQSQGAYSSLEIHECSIQIPPYKHMFRREWCHKLDAYFFWLKAQVPVLSGVIKAGTFRAFSSKMV
jgi:hypothetical protein